MQFKSKTHDPGMYTERKDPGLVPENGRVKVGVDGRGGVAVSVEYLWSKKQFKVIDI